jgi:hypothetical protein
VTADACSTCGHLLGFHDRHIRFVLPDPVLDTTGRGHVSRTWMSHENGRRIRDEQVPDLGAFVRALLPITLTQGHTITYSVWVAIDPLDLPNVFNVWFQPAYRDLRVSGRLANAISPWGPLFAPVEVVVRDRDHTPYCDHSDDPALNQVLHDEWPHEVVLGKQGQAGRSS